MMYWCTSYNKTEEEHMKHLAEVPDASNKNQLRLNLKKYEFLVTEMLFLGLEGIRSNKNGSNKNKGIRTVANSKQYLRG